ncbi:hypothetical protein HanXRQr2_Chr09g0376531 [Helianthus annuus]|uniref:Transposase (putative) gypsy type domain-containing protein n=1 Tax=Helianthus annuus TaxID=4232 RepID=A0A9K3I3Q2_HELAN|nr:hypothetical protein HanXRQr2_Chr09g0376531 [Helianthus annuus]KAJ0525198.1 hypothetical protein HanHA300_Chr09g0309241 [Helianthus annuus]
MGVRKDMGKTFSRLTQEDVDSFCEQWDIDPSVNLVAPGCNKPVDQCPSGFIALYCRHFEFSNLRYPFSVFVLIVLEYYRVSFGQLHPHGVYRVLHFEVLCRALGYDPTLLMFRRFFRLAKNDRFFWVSESVIPFKMVWRHPNAVLNELEPFASKLDEGMLEALRACPSPLRPFPEHLLVFIGVRILWDKPNRDLMFMKGDQVMSALDFIKSDDTSDVVLGDVEAIKGEDVITRTAEGRLVPGGSMLACRMLRVSRRLALLNLQLVVHLAV